MPLSKVIFLIGFSCSGKSTVGPRLARKLKTMFYDIDKLIERKAKKTIRQIFDDASEKIFRKYEKEIFFKVSENRYKSKVIALGGGAFENAEIRKYIKQMGVSVYLQCSQRELYRRIHKQADRPLLKVSPRKGETEAEALKNKIKVMLNKRVKNYKKADIIISTTDKNIAEIVNEIIKKTNKYNAAD